MGRGRSGAEVVGESGLVRVTVSTPRGRLDLALPGAVPVLELVPDLAQLAGLLDGSSAGVGFDLLTSCGTPLAGDAGLVAQGVADGGILVLSAGADRWAPRVDDLGEAIGDVVRQVPAWDAAAGRLAALLGATVALVGAVVVLLCEPVSGLSVGLASGLAVALLGAAGLLSRLPDRRTSALPVAWVGCGYAATAGWLLAEQLPGATPLVLASGAGSLAASLATRVVTTERLSMVPVIGAGTLVLLAGLLQRVSPADPVVVLTVAMTGLVVCGRDLAWWVAGQWSSGLERTPLDVRGVDVDAVRRRVGSARDALAAFTATVGLLLVVACPLAVSLGLPGVLVAVSACAVMMLRTRRLPRREVLIGLGAGLGGLMGVSTVVLCCHPSWRPWLSGGLASVGVVLLLLGVVRQGGSPLLSRLATLGEALAIVVLLPALVLASGAVAVVEGGG